MPDLNERDPIELQRTLAEWLATKLGPGAAPEVTEVLAPASNGFSNETVLCRAKWDDGSGSEEHRLVFRVHPTKHLLFLDADFDVQYKVMKCLADAGSAVPLPALGWFEESPEWLGVPFFTMEHVEGLVPADNLPYTMEGWVLEATAGERARMWWSGIEAMAEVHRTDWRSLDLGWLVPPGTTPGLDAQLDYYRRFLDWTAQGRPQPTAEAVWKWLVANQPAESGDVTLCWGDARLGNIIWQDFDAAAVIDWEMATLAQPELDLGWWLYFDRQFTEGLGVERPSGFPSHEATVERYGELLGRDFGDLFWYQVFSGFRFAVVMCRLSDLLVGTCVLPGESDMGTNNLATQFLAQLLDLPSPAEAG